MEVAFTDATLDLGVANDRLETALDALGAATGTAFALTRQVHGDVVVEAEGATVPGADLPEADGQVTASRGVGLMVRVADCVPVVLADGDAGVVGVAHAGRKGAVLDVTTRAIERMRQLGATRIHAWVGPHVCGSCYEVPEPLQAEVEAALPGTAAQTSWGTPSLDIGAAVRRQLTAAGVDHTDVAGCTMETSTLHSYRRDGADAGRFAGLVWLP